MKKLNTKQILIIAWIVLTIISVSLCGYFGWEKVRDDAYTKGFDSGQINLANQIIQGRRITTDTGVIMFIPNQ